MTLAVEEEEKGVDRVGLESIIEDLLVAIGEDPTRPGLRDTPRRVAGFWAEFMDGVDANMETTFEHVTADQMIVVRGITGWSLCEHHLLPFSFTATVGYIPKEKILGLSKFPRVVRQQARALQVQENLTREIADVIQVLTGSEHVAVKLEGLHLCSVMRGVKAEGATIVTQDIRGFFMEKDIVRQEFMDLAKT